MVAGIGINDSNYVVCKKLKDGTRWECPFYRTWKGMITRCYGVKSKTQTNPYFGVTVCKSWHKFSNFKKWMEKQDWKDKAIDKDIIYPDNKKYSPKRCVFVYCSLNNLLTNSRVIRGKYPQGVNWNKVKKGFDVRMRVHGVKKSFGRFKNTEEASRAYKVAKIDYIKTFMGSDVRVDKGLKRHIKKIKMSI